MATTTTNYGLTKPDATDNFADFRESYNNNLDTIDENLGGGGSSVVANPVDPPTDDLLTVEIDGTVYAIPGGGGSSIYTADVLYDDATNNATLNLAHPITDYDQIILVGYAPADDTDYRKTSVYDVTYIEDFIGTTTKLGVTGDAWYCWYTIADASTLTRADSNTIWVRTVIGVKYGESRGSIYTADVLLSSPGADLSTINLAHPITDYDQILLIARSQANGTEYRLTTMYDAEFIEQYLGTDTKFGVFGDDWYLWYTFTDASTMSKAANSWIWLETIIGIKYGDSAYQKEVLLTNSPNDSPLVLSGDITDYDQILLVGRSTANSTEYRIATLYDVDFVKNFLGTTVKFGVTTNDWYSWYMFATASSMNRHNSNQVWVFSVIGMKFVGSTGGSKGHTIIDENGNEMPSRKNLHFTGAVEVTDDEINGETLVNILGGSGSADISSIVHEVIHQDSVSIADNTQITLNLTNKYTDPFVFATNSLPLSSWGGLIVVQDSTVVYDSINDTLTFKVYVNSGQTYNVDWVVMDKEASNGSGKGSDQIVDISSFTKIYDSSIPFGYNGSRIDEVLGLTNEVMIALNMTNGWDYRYSAYYDSENQIGAYGGYQLNTGIKLNRVRFYIGRYSGQNLDLTVTAQYLDGSGTWHDIKDMVISTSINYPVCSFDVDFSSLEKVYGVRWYHYKTPEKSPSNNICFFGMIMYKAASVVSGGSISYGYDIPQNDGTDGSLYYLLSSANKKIGEFLYMVNQWVLVAGTSFTKALSILARKAQRNYGDGATTYAVTRSSRLLCINININSSADTQTLGATITGGTLVDSVELQTSYGSSIRNHVSNVSIIDADNGDTITLSNVSNGSYVVQLHAVFEVSGLDGITDISDYEHLIKTDGDMGLSKTFNLNGLYLVLCFESSGNGATDMNADIEYSGTDSAAEYVYETGIFSCKAMIVDAVTAETITLEWANKSSFVSRGYLIYSLS